MVKFDGQRKNWLQFFAECKSALAKDKVLLVATGAEIYPLDLQPNEVPQAQRYAAQQKKQEVQKKWRDDNALAKVRLEEHLAEHLQVQYRARLDDNDITRHQLITQMTAEFSVEDDRTTHLEHVKKTRILIEKTQTFRDWYTMWLHYSVKSNVDITNDINMKELLRNILEKSDKDRFNDAYNWIDNNKMNYEQSVLHLIEADNRVDRSSSNFIKHVAYTENIRSSKEELRENTRNNSKNDDRYENRGGGRDERSRSRERYNNSRVSGRDYYHKQEQRPYRGDSRDNNRHNDRRDDFRSTSREPTGRNTDKGKYSQRSCWDYSQGRCDRGSKCRFKHASETINESRTLEVCRGWKNGNCNRGDRCWFLHEGGKSERNK
jgi:hypothetical protein